MNAPPAKSLLFSGRETGLIPLLGFILLSAFVHAFGFFIFQIVYPPAARLGPPPVQVGLLAPGTPEADAILRWIDSDDPALAAEPGHAPIPGLMSLPYIPSYSVVRAQPAMAPSTDKPLPDPAGLSGLDLVKMAASHPSATSPPAVPAATALSFSGPLGDAAADSVPSLDSLHEGDLGELQPARFLLGVSSQGEVRYVFLQDSSGDKILDAGAGHLLQQVRFRPAIPLGLAGPLPSQISNLRSAISNPPRPSTAPLTWGFATFYWGSAVYARPSPGPEAAGP